MIAYVERVELHLLALSGIDYLPRHLDNVILIAFQEAEEHLLRDELVILALLEVRF